MRKITIMILSSLCLIFCGRAPIQLMEAEVGDPSRSELSNDQVLEVPAHETENNDEQETLVPDVLPDLLPDSDLQTNDSAKYSVESSVNLCENWIDASQLQIGPEKPTDLSGDTYAAYGLFTMQRKNLQAKYVFKVKGNMPDARFVSFETYHKYIQNKVDQLYDYELMDSDRMESMTNYAGTPYEFFVIDQGVTPVSGVKNIRLPQAGRLNKKNMSMFYRVFAPVDGQDVKVRDLPKVYAYNPQSGDAVACPQPYQSQSFIMNQKHVDIFKGSQHKRSYPFKAAPNWFDKFGFGGNSAVPWYVLEFNKLFADSVSIIKFKVPTHSGQSDVALPQVRYWSLCSQDFGNNMTIGCVPDEFAQPDDNGFVTVVYAKSNAQLERKVSDLGYNFLPDIRKPDQNTIGFNYRNLFPAQGFATDTMYQGDYLPKARTCTVSEFLSASSVEKCGI